MGSEMCIRDRFNWTRVEGAFTYEIRRSDGGDWDHSFFQAKTSNLQADIDPVVYGTYVYLIKALDGLGRYSLDATAVTFIVPQIGGSVISKQVIDNNVLLSWTVPASTFNIAYYILERNGVEVGTINGTFTTFFEVLAGTYTYSMIAVDIVGNRGSRFSADVIVNQPPDFGIQDFRTSQLLGPRVDVLRTPGPKLLCNYRDHTWQEHFVNRSWLSPQDQVNAQYPIYIQPINLTGSYEETFDYGIVFHNVIVTIAWNTNDLSLISAMGIVVKLQVSEDGTNYSAYSDGASQFFDAFRYLKLRLEFTGEDDHALIELFNLTITLNVKRENDGGEVAAVATDPGGTVVNFNKLFRDIESITCTTKSTLEPFVVIFDFQDVPDPRSFKVLVFDTMGARVSRTVDWKARGII